MGPFGKTVVNDGIAGFGIGGVAGVEGCAGVAGGCCWTGGIMYPPAGVCVMGGSDIGMGNVVAGGAEGGETTGVGGATMGVGGVGDIGLNVEVCGGCCCWQLEHPPHPPHPAAE